MVKFNFWIWCSDCKVYMELGTYNFEGGHFDGPLIPLENRRVNSDWALRRFLEDHTGHRMGLQQDIALRHETSPMKIDWKCLHPVTKYCMVFEESSRLLESLSFPSHFKRLLFIVDVYDWAWDIASKELLSHLPEVEGEIISIRDFFTKEVNPQDYDLVFIYPWGSKQLMDVLNPKNTVVCVAGGEQLRLASTFKYNCSRFKFFGANNSTLAKTIKEWHPIAKVSILSHGVETDLFKPIPISHEGFVVGWAGSTARDIKRFPLAQEIAREAGVLLNVAGFKNEDTYRPHEEMPYFYSACDAFLVTSEFEAHPMVVYESMACGIPVITTRVGDVDENIVDGYTGFVLEVDAPVSEFVEKIKMLQIDPQLRGQMGARARQSILRKWTWDKIADQYRGLGVTMNE